MKKKLSIILAFVLAFCISIPVFAKPSDYPTGGVAANEKDTTFTIQKNYVKKDKTTPAEKFPDETLTFEAVCTHAPMDVANAPKVTVDPLTVAAVTSDITVHVPEYTVPGKYNYTITEKSPSAQNPDSKDTAGVIYDKDPVYIQVVVKYTKAEGENESTLKKFITVTSENSGIGAGNDLNQGNGNKKADFKNRYLLDGETDPEYPITPPGPEPTPEPDPNPVPSPGPENPDPDPIPTPGPNPGEDLVVEKAKLKVMKHVRGPLASREQQFTVKVTLDSEKPVRSDITYAGASTGTISKVGAGSTWTGSDAQGYKAEVTLQIPNGGVVTFSGVPAGVKYTVKEDTSHIGKLTEGNVNNPAEGYTVSYYGGGTKLDNPTNADAPEKDYGANLEATGILGYNTNNNIVISNSKGLNNEDSDMVKPNTGINLDSLPYIIILCLVIAGAGMMLVKSRKRGEE